jgi:PKD repeat protein
MQDTDLEELFRRTLDNAELMPGADVNARLMRKLARREFLRFNPAKFNIYYLGLLVAGAITAGILLFGGKDSEKKINKDQSYIIKQESVIPETDASLKTVKKDNRKRLVRENNKELKVFPVGDITDSISGENERREDMTITPAGIDNKLSKNNFFSESSAGNVLKEPSKAPSVTFTPSVLSGCPPLKVHFGNVTGDFTSYRWDFAGEGTSDKKEPDWTFYREGEYRISLIAGTPEGNSSSFSGTVRVFPRPVARFEISPEKAVIPDDEIRFLNNSSNAISSRWNFGDGSTSEIFEPKHKYNRYGNYAISLIVTSEEGCTDSVTVNDAFSGSGYFVEMPNAFIPNPDGPSGGFYSAKSDEISEIFHPVFSGVSDYNMKIYSKMGILIFESNDVNMGWDGYFKGQLSNPGVYIWKISGHFRNGQSFSKIGDVTLLKN